MTYYFKSFVNYKLKESQKGEKESDKKVGGKIISLEMRLLPTHLKDTEDRELRCIWDGVALSPQVGNARKCVLRKQELKDGSLEDTELWERKDSKLAQGM